MADIDLPLRLSENSLATLLGLVREQVAVARDLTEQALMTTCFFVGAAGGLVILALLFAVLWALDRRRP